MKRVNGIWYINAIAYNMVNGRLVKESHWLIAGTIERACMMVRGHNL